MREIISIHIGQAGLQMASSCWELFCLEHDIQQDGFIPQSKTQNGLDLNPDCLFSQSNTGKYVPRAIMIDNDPVSINTIKKSNISELLYNSQTYLLRGDEGAIWAGGFYCMMGYHSLDEILDQFIRKQIEACDGLQGIMIYHGVGGGIGGSIASTLLQNFEEKQEQLNKVTKFTISLLSSKKSNVIDPYNSFLTIQNLQTCSDLNLFIDNSALNRVLQQSVEIEYPNYQTLNRMIAQMSASITLSTRTQSQRFIDLAEMQANLTPDPKLHFLHGSYGPFIHIDKQNQEQINLQTVTNQLFHPKNAFINYKQNSIKYIASNLFYRGDCPLPEVNQAVKSLKSNPLIQFSDFFTKKFQLALSDKAPIAIPNSEFAKINKSVCSVSNSTAITQTLNNIGRDFKKLYRIRAFVHWYVGNGMEEGEFWEAKENVKNIIQNYKMIENENYNEKDIKKNE